MSGTKCYSVRLESFVNYSEKAYKAVAYDGSQAFIPKSCFFGMDYSVSKSDAYWIAAWILEKRELQYSSKKVAFFDENGKMIPIVIKEKYEPDSIKSVESNNINELKKQ